ncbi:MAG: hypothetical protein IT443_07885 [Phycisphaeraceae bacterium]|nr:hypothetical protein [Phycisphaeraceae bacterium]
MAEWFKHLQTNVENHQPKVLAGGAGRLLLTVGGARVLACEVEGVEGSLFWHPPALDQQPGKAKIGGGDRLWIAPEVAYFWPSLEKARLDPVKYAAVPPQMDPAEYRVVDESKEHLRVGCGMTLTDARVSKKISLKVEREIRLIAAPQGLPAGVRTVSFALTNSLQISGGDAGALAGAWDILQVPPTGTLVCPTNFKVDQVRSYYDPFGPKHVSSDERVVRFWIDGKRRIKMGLKAEATTGRMGYYRKVEEAGNESTLIVRVFSPYPGEPYVDFPRSEEATARTGGDCLQAYNDDGTFGGFGEMEYHDPALIVGQTTRARAGHCVTHVMVGQDQAVRAAGRMLLGVEEK